MTLTEAVTQQKYLDAQSELDAILRSRTASRQQKRAALDALDELDRRFLRRTMSSLESRTQRFREFIEHMQHVVNAIERAGSPLKTLARLKKIVAEAADIMNENGTT
jgi:recombinational DNA repair ATPase RecF